MSTPLIAKGEQHATGICNGGDLAYRLVAELAGLFAAVAPVSGGISAHRS